MTLDDGTVTDALKCYRYGSTSLTTQYSANYIVPLIYRENITIGSTSYTGWWVAETNTTYSNASLGQGYTTCSTAASTAAKTASLSSYSLTTGGIVTVKFTYAVPANATLNIAGKGAKPIYYNGAAIKAGVIEAGDCATFIYSSQYHLISIAKGTMTGATDETAGAKGYVPAPAAGDDTKFLRGDGTWAEVSTTSTKNTCNWNSISLIGTEDENVFSDVNWGALAELA